MGVRVRYTCQGLLAGFYWCVDSYGLGMILRFIVFHARFTEVAERCAVLAFADVGGSGGEVKDVGGWWFCGKNEGV